MTDDKYRDQLAEALCRWWDDENGGDDFGHRGVEFPCQHCRGEAAALSPVVAQIRADAQAEVAAAIEAALDRPLGEYIVTAGEMAVRAALAPYRTTVDARCTCAESNAVGATSYGYRCEACRQEGNQ